MRTSIFNTVTETRENEFFSNFKNSKRVLWSERRHYSH